MTVALIITFAGGYLLGSIPIAYWVVKGSRGLDLRVQGTSNLGAYNTYEVTGSRGTGVIVGLLDALKGFLAWLFGLIIFHVLATDLTPLALCGASVIGAVTGHNYNVWLSLSSRRIAGGKGLATAAGGLLIMMPNVLIVWGLFFVLGWKAFEGWRGKPEIIAGNVLATMVAPLAALLLYNVMSAYIVVALATLILLKHVHQMRALLSAKPKTPR